MENVEKEFTPEESLQLISQVITKTRRSFKITSVYLILWGWVMVIASLACFSLIRYMVSNHQFKYINLGAWLTWMIPIFIAIIIERFYINRRHVKVERTKSLIGNIIQMLWYANGVAIIVGCFISYKLNFYPTPIILIIIGIPTTVTGYIIKFKPLMIGGVIFWLASIVSIFTSSDYQLIVCAISIFSGYLIPGYLLKYSKE
jgi:hypothetical protein